jgi:hypothetical protein
MTTQWSIAQLERTTATGGVTIAHWRATATDGDFSASSYGTCSFTPDADSEGFVAFEARRPMCLSGSMKLWIRTLLKHQ